MTARFHAHGTFARYCHGSGPDATGEGAGPPCREACCREVHNATQRVRRRRVAYGRHHTAMIDAQPVREHVQALRDAGVTLRSIAVTTAMSPASLIRLLHGEPARGRPPTARIRADRAARLRAVTVEATRPAATADPHSPVPAVGAMRRLQALAVRGWSGAEICARLPIEQKHLLKIRQGGRAQVTVRTAEVIAALYEQLWNLDPPRDTTLQRVYAGRTIAAAHAAGWAPVGAWDEIDDPDEEPDLGGDAAEDEADPTVIDAYRAGRARWSRLNEADRLLLVADLRARKVGYSTAAKSLGAPEYQLRKYYWQLLDAAAQDPAAEDAAAQDVA